MKRFFAMAILLIVIANMPSAMAANAPANGMKADLSEELHDFAQDRPHIGWSYSGEYGFTDKFCEPAAFKKMVEKALSFTGEEARATELHAVFTSLGFNADDSTGFPSYGFTSVELKGYGDVPAPWGQARVTAVNLSGNGTYLYFVFIKKDNGWYLMDCLMMDYFAVDSGYPYPELMLHWSGKPGAWLVTRSVGHGTGVYTDCRQWYNVFTRQFDIAYTLEGFDSTLESDGWYYAGWKSELGFSKEEVSDVLRFVTYEGMVKDPFDAPGSMGEEVISATVLHEYRYDPETASYRSTREERLPPMSPGSVYASGFLRERE